MRKDIAMRLQARITVLMLFFIACNQNPPTRVTRVFLDESCTKRRFDKIDGQGVTVSTYAPNGAVTVTAKFETLAEADKAFPRRTSGPCPNTTVSTSDLYPDAGLPVAPR
jgi:hypothetical protein